MVSFSTATVSSRTVQLVISVVMVGISSMIVKYKSEISNQTEKLSTYNLHMNGTSLTLDSNWKKSAAALGAGTFSLTSSSFNYMFPTIMRKIKYGFMNDASGIANKGSKYIELSMSEFLSSKPFQFNADHSNYFTLLASSETIGHTFWFTNMILQVSDYSHTQCTDVNSLLVNNNLTSTTSSLSNFFNILTNSTNNEWANSIYQELQDANLTQSLDINFNQVNTTEAQAQLLLSLGYDCQLKKASLGLTVVLWALYAVTTGLFTTDAIKFYSQFKNTQAKVNAQKKDTELAVKSNDDESVLLMYHHPWCLFRIFHNLGTTPNNEVGEKNTLTSIGAQPLEKEAAVSESD